MQLVATALAWHNLFLFMPKDPASDPVLQVQLVFPYPHEIPVASSSIACMHVG